MQSVNLEVLFKEPRAQPQIAELHTSYQTNHQSTSLAAEGVRLTDRYHFIYSGIVAYRREKSERNEAGD
jgi:hypothetical protein